MALFTTDPRIWSRNAFATTSTHYIYDDRYRDYIGPFFNNPVITVSYDLKTLAFCTTPNTPYTVSVTHGRAFDIQNSEYGVDSSVGYYASENYTQAAGGLVPAPITSPLPGWGLTAYSTPTVSSPHRWIGAYSRDKTIFAAILRLASGTSSYLTVTEGKETRASLVPMSFTHRRVGDNSRIRSEMQVIVVSLNEIWLLYLEATPPGAGDLNLKLAVWNGTTISSTQTLLTGDVQDFDMVRGENGISYLMYTMTVPEYTYYVRTMDDATRTLSAVQLSHVEPYTGYTWSAHAARIPSQLRPFPYKGKNYLIRVNSSETTVYTFTDAAPTTITRLRTGKLAWLGSSSNDFAKGFGIEYDPVSDTAFLVCFFPLVSAWMNTPPAETDMSRVYIARHAQALDAVSWDMPMQIVREMDNYRFKRGSLGDEEIECEYVGYVPSQYGVDAIGCMLFQHKRTISYSPGQRIYAVMNQILRVSNWYVPGDRLGEVPIALASSAAAQGAREYPVALSLSMQQAVDVRGYRARATAWKTLWGSVADSSVYGEVHINLTAEIDVAAAISETLFGIVEAAPSVDVYVDAVIERTLTFGVSWVSTGRTFVDEFHGYVNEHRASVWGLPPLPIAGGDPRSLDVLRLLDIAQRHCDNMAATRWYAHDSDRFPVGWQDADVRIGYVGDIGGENIQYSSGYFQSARHAPPTAYEAWWLWRNSPPHYANLMTRWSDYGAEYEGVVFSFLAVGFGEKMIGGDYGPDPNENAETQGFYLCNNFASIKETLVNVTLTERWVTDELRALLLTHSWQSATLSHVRGTLLSPYSMPLHIEHTINYSGAITAGHDISSTHSVSKAIDFVHSASEGGFQVSHSSSYDIKKATASVWHDMEWTRTLAASHDTDYDDAPRISATLVAFYDSPPMVSASLSSSYGGLVHATATHKASYSILAHAARGHDAPAPLGGFLSQSHTVPYSLQQRNSVAASLRAIYDMHADGAGGLSSFYPTVSLNGKTILIEDGYITCDYESPAYSFECTVADLSFIQGAKTGDRLDVDISGTAYVLFLSSISSASSERSAAPTVNISGLSPVALLDAPYSETITYAPDSTRLFSEVIEEVLGTSVGFASHIDWVVPYGRAQSTAQTPMALAKGFLASVGSRLLSNPDGSVYALPRYPRGFDALQLGTPEHTLSEVDDVFTRNYSHEYARGYNRFRIRDSDSGYGDVIEFDKETGIASVWVSPYRTSWSLRCTTSPGILLDALGEVVEEREEVWDFAAGSATATSPIFELVSSVWLTDSLGGFSFEPYSSRVTAPVTVHFGYGLVKVRYRTKSSKFRLSSSTPIDATQLIIVEQ